MLSRRTLRGGGVLKAQETANPPISFSTSEDGKTLTISGQGDLTSDGESAVIDLINTQVKKGVKTSANDVTGTYENIKLVNANSAQPLVIDKSIVSAILFPTTNGYPRANLTTKHIDLGEATVNNLSGSIFLKPDGDYWAGILVLEHITLPLTNKTTVKDEYTQVEEERMVVPANFMSPINENGIQSLKTITIPEGYEEIGEKAFYHSSNITTCNLPSTLKKIDDSAFEVEWGGLTSVTLNDGLEHIGKRAFAGVSSLTSVNFPSSVKVIDDYAFVSVPLKNLKFHAGLEYIGNSAFALASQITETVLEIPASVKYIGPFAFKFREYQDVYFYGSKAPLMPVGISTAFSTFGSYTAFSENLHNGHNGFTPTAGTNYSDDMSTGYANRGNYYNNQAYICILHFPKGLGDDDKATYTDITRVYETKPEGSTSAYQHVGEETSTLTYRSCTAYKDVDWGFKDTYMGEQCIWPSMTQLSRSYAVNSNGYNWNGVTEYRPTLSEEDLKLLAYGGFKVGTGEGEYSADELSKIAYLGTRQFPLAQPDVNSPTDPDKDPDYPVKVKGGNWWTICVPFNMTKAQVDNTFGEGTHVCRFSGVDRTTIDGEKHITLRFQNDVYTHKSEKDANGNYTTDANASVAADDIVIYAHEAYMIYPTISNEDANGLFHIEDYQLVTGSPLPTVVKANASDQGSNADHTQYRFIGNYQTEYTVGKGSSNDATTGVVTIPQYSYMFNKKVGDAKYKFWFYTGNKLAWEANKCLVQNNAHEGGKADYTNFFGGNGSSMAKVSQQSVFGFDDEATGIEQVSIVAGEGKDAQTVYNLNGEVVSRGNQANALPRGIYIQNGKKFVVR